MEAVILAGGFGTRLAHIVKDVPKPLADINGKPFLCYLFDYLIDNGINKVVLATGYKHEYIENYFSNKYKDIDIVYSREISPLGTGGAIKKALEKCEGDNVFVVNGDTFFNVDLLLMKEKYISFNTNIMIAAKELKNFDRYGSLTIQNDKIVEFNEKRPLKEGLINGGVYFMNKHLLENIKQEKFSFECDFLEKDTIAKNISVFISNGYFIDIGVPEDYSKAQKELKNG